MVTNPRDAKGRFSELVKPAAEAEEILITVRGEPMARLTRVVAAYRSDDRAASTDELTVAAAREASCDPVSTSQGYRDESRSDR
jgi:antitoxin (DNA-binding transcriptional repressor) of toxin-antitoxin stability system